MTDTSQGPGWWLAADGKWYAPEQEDPTYVDADGTEWWWDGSEVEKRWKTLEMETLFSLLREVSSRRRA